MAAGVPTATTFALVSGGVAVAVALYFTTQVPIGGTDTGAAVDAQVTALENGAAPEATAIAAETDAKSGSDDTGAPAAAAQVTVAPAPAALPTAKGSPDVPAELAGTAETRTAALSVPLDAPTAPGKVTTETPATTAPAEGTSASAPEPTDTPTTAGQSAEPALAAPASDSPQFDIVRVENDGSALVAGTAAPGAEVTISFGGETLEVVQADTSGSFVSFLQLPQGDDAQPLRLSRNDAGGARVYSEQTVLIVPPERGPALAQPTIVIADASGAQMLQPAFPDAPSEVARPQPTAAPARDTPQAPAGYGLSLETISYDDSGDVVLSGRGKGARFVRIYVDNTPVETSPVPEDGAWQVVLPGVEAGVHTLRVDEISETGKVTARVESPFKRETPGAVAQAARVSPTKSSVTVQPGHTLWALALQNYGDGVKYVQIFNANKDRIRNADLIYPGQVFDIPDDR